MIERLRRRVGTVTAVGLLGLGVLAGATGLVVHHVATGQAAGSAGAASVDPTSRGPFTDLHGRPVVPDEGVAVPAHVAKQMNAVADAGARFRVPAVGLDVPLGELSMAGGTITPPAFTSAYAVRNLGAGPSRPKTGTVFVAMHSLRGGGVGPGNYLIDAREQRAAVGPGAVIEVGPTTYRVTGSELVDRAGISEDAGVWADRPGRLVVLTCMQSASGDRPPTQNLVIFAELSAT
jgi:hypothetical protein